MNIVHRNILVLLLCAFSTERAVAQVGDPLFYRSLSYGSQAAYSPLSVIANGSFDILQITNRNNRMSEIAFATGARNVWWNLTRPGSVIRQYGWGHFLRTEVFPTSIRLSNAQYWPNYKLHLIGGGMTYVAMREWYTANGAASPALWSAGTMAVYHALNEIVENDRYVGPTVDPLADLLIFDPLGIILFSNDGVARFFSKTLRMADWSFQPVVGSPHLTLLNNGQVFIFKVPTWWDDWRIFYITGTEGGLGLTRSINATDAITGSLGEATRELVEVDNHTGVRTLTARLIWTAGLYYDRNNSLLASAVFGGSRGYLARINLYPGVVNILGGRLGACLLFDERHHLTIGLTLIPVPFGVSATSR